MPELPDVEVFRRYFARTVLNQPIRKAQVWDREMVKAELSPEEFSHRLEGGRFSSTQRHGKYFFAVCEAGWLVLHFGMTGTLTYLKKQAEIPAHTRLLLTFGGGSRLVYQCRRRLGEIDLIHSVEDFIREKNLGPDALQIPPDTFAQVIGPARGSIKSALMNQQRLAGIGNVYSDEILYQAGLHPRTSAAGLKQEALASLFAVLRRVLKAAIDARADLSALPAGYLLPYRKKGESCPACGTEITTDKVSGRTAYFCPRCQKN